MLPFRKNTPKRRHITRDVSKHGEHREDLKIDFMSRCGYCDDIDTWRVIWFEIDHFVPQKYLSKIKPTDYSNLVYSCRSCNNAKRAKWPSKDEKVNIVGNEGFIDPCESDYDSMFSRTTSGRIIPTKPLGKWMYFALKLHKPQHEIIWIIDALDELIEEIHAELQKTGNEKLKDRLLTLLLEFRNYQRQLANQ